MGRGEIGLPGKTSVMVSGGLVCLWFVLCVWGGGGREEAGPSTRMSVISVMSVMVIVGLVWVWMGRYDGEV